MSAVDPTTSDGEPATFDTLVLGIGNVLWADEGFGIRAVELMNERYEFPDNVRVMDGGTQGIFLLPWVRGADRLLIFDAVDFGLPPGTLKVVEGDDVPRYMGIKKMSMHQAGFQEVLSTAELSGELPAEIVLIGVQPERLDDFGGSLRDVVREQIGPAVDIAINALGQWGITAVSRGEPLPGADRVGPGALEIEYYELGRPRLGTPSTT
ncbi:MAG: HyaD/HybD family hydrogenase maturation endopeptidase [Woeseiaceae bacterium]|nr:HyaD/HybD family hydrogenase maturation endopeptidase [Woeseiaceae bacterium]